MKFNKAGTITARFQEATPMKPRKIETEHEEWEVDIKYPRLPVGDPVAPVSACKFFLGVLFWVICLLLFVAALL